MRQRRMKGASSALRALTHCHEALTAYGVTRLDSVGWRELGVGSLSAANDAFRTLALQTAAGWATYESRDRLGQTIAEIALEQPHWFSERYQATLELLAGSRLDLFTVVDSSRPERELRRVRDGLILPVANAGPWTPAGVTLMARVVVSSGHAVVLTSVALPDEALSVALEGRPPRSIDDWSRRLLDATLRHFLAVDADGRGAAVEPLLLGLERRDLARLHHGLRSLERTLDSAGTNTLRHYGLNGRNLLAERHGAAWRIVVSGEGVADTVERIPAEAAHPADVELMRQIGARPTDGVLSFRGNAAALAHSCARAAVAQARRVA